MRKSNKGLKRGRSSSRSCSDDETDDDDDRDVRFRRDKKSKGGDSSVVASQPGLGKVLGALAALMKQQEQSQRGSGSSSSSGDIPIEFYNRAALGAASRHMAASKKHTTKKGSVEAKALPSVDEECESPVPSMDEEAEEDDEEKEEKEEADGQQPAAPGAIVPFGGPIAGGKKPAAADPIASLLKAAESNVVAVAKAAPKYCGRGRGSGRGRGRGSPAKAAATVAIPKAKPKPAAMKKPAGKPAWPFDELWLPNRKKVCWDWL